MMLKRFAVLFSFAAACASSSLGLNIFHHILLRGVPDSSVHRLQHHKEDRLLDDQTFLGLFGLDFLVWFPLTRATELCQHIFLIVSPGLQHFSLDEQDSVTPSMLDLLLDMISLHHEVARVVGDPILLGYVARRLATLGRGSPDDRESPNVVISSVHSPRNTFALGWHGAEFVKFTKVPKFVAVHNLFSSSDEGLRSRYRGWHIDSNRQVVSVM